MKLELTVAVCQMTSIDNVQANLAQIKELIAKVPKSQAVDLFCFPENCLYMRLREGEKVEGLKVTDAVFQELMVLAKDRNAALHMGASPILVDGHVYNASVLVRPDGHISVTYKKVHLFDIQLSGQKPMRESDVFKHGTAPVVLELEGWKIGQSICYDLRFAELYSYYARKECDLILVPSSFLPKTGEAHWEILLRARAIESQAYLVAAAQSGRHKSGHEAERQTYGHSLIVDPWGQVLVDLVASPSVEVCTFRKDRIAEVRRQIPMKSHRRAPFVS